MPVCPLVTKRSVPVCSTLLGGNPEVALDARIGAGDVRSTVWACVHYKNRIPGFQFYLRRVKQLVLNCVSGRKCDELVRALILTNSGFGQW